MFKEDRHSDHDTAPKENGTKRFCKSSKNNAGGLRLSLTPALNKLASIRQRFRDRRFCKFSLGRLPKRVSRPSLVKEACHLVLTSFKLP